MTLTSKELEALRPDAVAPAGIEAKAEALANVKANMPLVRMFVLAMLAGAFIACGATLFSIVQGDASLPFVGKRLLGGACFALGLVMVVCCGAELFTGNCLMVCGVGSKKATVGGLLRNWVVVYLGNLIGSLIIVALVFASNMAAMNGGAVGDAMVSTAVGKVTPDVLTLLCKGILCNFLVCLAVWMSFGARTMVDKIAVVFLPVMAFVACGFEHSIANMFFLPMGLVANAAGYGASVASVGSLTIAAVLVNIAVVTVGNIIGGSLMVGGAYWLAYHREQG